VRSAAARLAYRRDVESASGIVALAVFLLWFGFYVPHRAGHRQQLLEARTEDRFSGALRVLAVVGPAVAGPVAGPAGGLGAVGSGVAAVAAGPTGTPRALLGPGPGGPGSAVQRVRSDGRAHQEGEHAMDGTPSAAPRRGAAPRTPDTSSVSAPRASPSRLAMLERRAAAARRRLALTVVLLLGSAAVWVVVGLGVVPWWAGAVPTALLALVLVLGRRAVLAAQRADAVWLAERRAETRASRGPVAGGPPAPRTGRPRVTGRAVHGSQLSTQMIPRVSVREAVRASGATSGSRDSRGGAPADPADASDDAAESTTSPTARATVRTGTATDEPRAPRSAADVDDATAAPAPAAETRTDAQPPAPTPGVEKAGDRRDDHVASGRAWDPVPVPRPTYTMKPSAPRREPAPLPRQEPSASAGAAPVVVAPPATERVEGDAQKPRTETLGLDLNEILARRRAAGQ
jgi:hypothetical protein